MIKQLLFNMANIIPTQLFPGYVSDGTTISIPIADLNGLTPAEADPATGNGMEVLRALLEKSNMQLTAMAQTARPVRFSLIKAAPAIATSPGVPPGTLRQVYTLAADLTPTGLEPAAE